MNRKLRATRSTQQIQEEHINFLLEDVEENLEGYKKVIEIKDKQLSDIKKYSRVPKKVTLKKVTLKKYIENIKQRYQQYQKQHQQEYFNREREYFRQKQPKNIKK